MITTECKKTKLYSSYVDARRAANIAMKVNPVTHPFLRVYKCDICESTWHLTSQPPAY